MTKPATYEVTLRRDVQQVTRVRVDASSRQEAIDVAEPIVDDDAWAIEAHIGTHRPQVQLQSKAPIKGRATGKADRRTDTDRRADKRRLGDKSRALVAARNKRSVEEGELAMAETRTRTNSRSSVSGRPVKKNSTRRRPKTVIASDKVKTTDRKTATVRASSATTTRRGNSTRTTRR